MEYGFEKEYSYNDGWGGSQSTTKTSSYEVEEEVDPRTKLKVKMVMTLNKIRVPYTAKYRVTFDDKHEKIVKDKGEMTRVLETKSDSTSFVRYKLDDEAEDCKEN